MTPLRQRAEELVNGHWNGEYCPRVAAINAIHAALQEVVEECAKVAEGCKPIAHGNVFRAQREQADKIAAAIRQQEAR